MHFCAIKISLSPHVYTGTIGSGMTGMIGGMITTGTIGTIGMTGMTL